MPLDIPSRGQLDREGQAYLRGELPSLDPTPSRRSLIGALWRALQIGLRAWYVALKTYADHQPFPQTATGKFLTQGWWRDITKLDPIAAAPARGTVMLTGLPGTPIPAGIEVSANGVTFTSETATSIVTQSLMAAALTFDSGTGRCIFQTASPHLVATGLAVTISGAVPAEFNGSYTVTASNDDELYYVPDSVPGSATATGTPLLTATWAHITVEAGATGSQTNVSAGGTLQVQTAIPGLDTKAIAGFGGLQGGADDETDDAYRERILEVLGTDYGAFTGDEIAIVAKQVPGVTKVIVKKATLNATNGVAEGQVKVAFLRGNDASPIPSAQEVADVKAVILASCMTANTAPEDVIVTGGIERRIAVAARIVPDTLTMRAAVKASLQQYFDESAAYETSVPALDLDCAVKAAFDFERRQRLVSFTLTFDGTVGTNEWPFLGDVTFV